MGNKLNVPVLIAAAALSAAVTAQPYGPPMSGGYGQGPGMMGGPGAMGPGMMGGYGPGMMGGYGPGMMGGYGPGMMGPGMMGGYGPGMMGGWAWPADLSADQKAKLADAQQEFQQKQWGLMQQMHQLMWSSNAPGSTFDEQAARKNYDASAALHKQMFENSIELRKRIEATLTPQQREEMQRGWRR